MSIEIGDIVRGTEGAPYGITNQEMLRGVVTGVRDGLITVVILEHRNEDYIGSMFDVEAEYFEVTGRRKELDRDEIMELIRDGNYGELMGYDLREADLGEADLRRADLWRADLREADLRGADLDFAVWPLWCGGLHVKIDKRIACQLAYHFCAQECDDPEYIAARNAIIGFANGFHRVKECGRLEAIK